MSTEKNRPRSLHDADNVIEHAITEAEERVKKETGLPVFRGHPG